MKAGKLLFSRPGNESVELVSVENGDQRIEVMTAWQALRLAHNLQGHAMEIIQRRAIEDTASLEGNVTEIMK